MSLADSISISTAEAGLRAEAGEASASSRSPARATNRPLIFPTSKKEMV